MTGMNSGLDPTSPALVAAFRSALLHQLIIIAALVVVLVLAYRLARQRWAPDARPVPAPEPRSRRFLRIAFGLLWIVDGILQAQPEMAGGLPSQVMEPSAASSPSWVQHLVDFGGTVWSYHPVQAAASAVWIQVGVGLWLIAAATGWSSRLAGLSSAAWGLVVWVFGESFGGIFGPGLSWLSGAPGAVLLYLVAGVLIALPLRAWSGPRVGRLLLAGIGVFWVGMAVLQALPGRGSWLGGDSGALPGMVSDMADLSQPQPQAQLMSAVESFTSDHAFAVNLFVVIALGVLGAALASGLRPVLRFAVPAATVFCLAVWVLVQDIGLPGGLGTDPNSMVPWVLLVWGGLFAVTDPVTAAQPAPVSEPARPRLRQLVTAAASPRALAAIGAVGVILLGAAPMAMASVDRNADPIIEQAIAGAPLRLDRLAPDFQLVDGESGRQVDLSALRGKVVLLTFLDPVCTGCPQIAEEMHSASGELGGDRVQLVAIAASTEHSNARFIRAFDQHQGLTSVPNWLFLTGSGAALQQTWNAYERFAPNMMAGMMVHSQVVFVIDATGRIRWEVRNTPGPPTASAQSSSAGLLADAARQTLN